MKATEQDFVFILKLYPWADFLRNRFPRTWWDLPPRKQVLESATNPFALNRLISAFLNRLISKFK